MKTTGIGWKLGIPFGPGDAEPVPKNSTPKQILERYRKLYEAAQMLTIASTLRIDGWELYALRAKVFAEMHEYDLAWQDCQRCVSLVETGYTKEPPPNKYDN